MITQAAQDRKAPESLTAQGGGQWPGARFRSGRGAWREQLARGAGAEEGATLVETAIAISVFMMVMLGIFEMCLALYTYHFVSDAAREATRYAIVRGSSCQYFPDCNLTSAHVGITSDQVQTYIQGLGFPIMNRSLLSVTVTWPSTGQVCLVTNPCNNPGAEVNAVVTYPYPLSIPFWQATTINISSTSQMTISQ